MDSFEKYKIARWAYSIGKEFIPNYEWDLLHKQFLQDSVHSAYAQTSWSQDECPIELLRKYNLTDLIREIVVNTDKSESIPSIITIIEAQHILNQFTTPVLFSTKADGWNIQVDYYDGKLVQARTRGRSSDAVQAANLEPHLPQTIPLKGKVRIFGECVCPNELFQILKQRFGVVSQRNCVSTALAKEDYSYGLQFRTFYLESDLLQFSTMIDMWSKLKELGFLTIDYIVSYENHYNNFSNFSNIKSSVEYPTDGCVVQSLQMPSKDKYAFRIASWAEPYYNSYVTGFTPSYAPLYMGLQVEIYPIITATGSTQRVLDIDNLDRILKNNLEIGAPIAFTLRSHAIADIDEALTENLQNLHKYSLSEYQKNVRDEEEAKKLQ